MARSRFGGTSNDFAYTASTVGSRRLVALAAAGNLTYWDAETGGSRYTDLMIGGALVDTVPVRSDGQVPTFYGPDDLGVPEDRITEMWEDGGGGSRVLVVTTDSAGFSALRDAAEGARADAEVFRDEAEAVATDGIRRGNLVAAYHPSFHPSGRPTSTFFDGNSHPLGSYFANLAAAQVLYPHATSLSDEADWAALQLALNSVTAYPKGWGAENTDWRQYGTALLTLPIGALALVNRPLTKVANANKNYVITSPAVQGARIKYTGVDGGRIIDFERDSVGSVLIVSNLDLEGGGVRLKAAYRGDIRIGNGCHIIDTPHPAIQFEDTPSGVTGGAPGVGVVGPVIENLYTSGCTGSIYQLSSTATITTVRDFRCLNNHDVAIKINGSTDILIENGDCTGMEASAAAAGKPYMQVSGNLDTTNNVDIRDMRCGSEAFTAGAVSYTPPKEMLVLGELTGTSTAMGMIRLRKIEFRSPAVVSSTVARAAILVKAKCQLDVDDCDFGEFNDCLIDEAYLATETTYFSSTLTNFWGPRNTVDAGHLAPIFSNGGVNYETSARMLPAVIDKRAAADPSDQENLLSTDLSTWSATNVTVGARTTGGPNGTYYYPMTKTAAGAVLFKATVSLTAGKHYCFGITARKGTMRTMRMRAAIGSTVMVDSRQIRLDGDWVTYMVRIPYVATTGAVNIGFYLDNDEETPASPTAGFGTMDVLLPFLTEGWIPRPPRTGMRLSTRLTAPVAPVSGMTYQADGTSWDPLTRAAGLPYLVFWNGSTYQAVSNIDPVASAPTTFDMVQTGGDQTLTASDATNYQDLAGCSIASLPVGTYRVSGYSELDAAQTADVAYKFTPGGGMVFTGSWDAFGPQAGATSSVASITGSALSWTGNRIIGGLNVGTGASAFFEGLIVVTTAGTIKLQAHQGTADATVTKVRNTAITFRKVA